MIGKFLLWILGDDAKNRGQVNAVIAAAITQPRFSKEHMPKYTTALGIALDAHVLKECNEHFGVYVQASESIEKAYKLGDAQFTEGTLTGVFESRREMMDVIKEVVDDYAGACDVCASQRPY